MSAFAILKLIKVFIFIYSKPTYEWHDYRGIEVYPFGWAFFIALKESLMEFGYWWRLL